ncbi:HpcH/HpaI aldolase family protein [Shumkonia mesophila]|uniref:HpcH/HpaI aldolase family protein n=1 Tax=Shumkonia mesophila TaxID=2838854 RepID=UPI0029345AF3|nr:aldolase/citrate lyase family protein [Shumkonia mesophila]
MPLPINAFKKGLTARNKMLGVWAISGSAVVAEALGFCGYDFVVLDMEHAPNDVPRILALLQAVAGTPAASVVRLPWNDAVVVKQVLDCGVQTIMFPYIQTADDARRAVAATRYPPDGVRGVAGMSRATRYGSVPDYFRVAAGELCVVVQIETAEAVGNLQAIADVDGVDCLFVGPNDLSASLGRAGQTDHPEVRAKLAEAVGMCADLGKPCGILAANAARADEYLDMGYNWVAAGSDLGLLLTTARQNLKDLRAGA